MSPLSKLIVFLFAAATSLSAQAVEVYHLAIGSQVELGQDSKFIVPAGSGELDLGVITIEFKLRLDQNTDFRSQKMKTKGLAVIGRTTCSEYDDRCFTHEYISIPVEHSRISEIQIVRGNARELSNLKTMRVEDLNEVYEGLVKITPNEEVVKP